MNEEIEYAEMLEIPVSTVNVIRKSKNRAKAQETEFKNQTIASANERFAPYAVYSSSLYEEEQAEDLDNDNDYAPSEKSSLEGYQSLDKKNIVSQRILKAEFGVACARCLGIFLTNVWVKIAR